MAIIRAWRFPVVMCVGTAMFSALSGCAGVTQNEYDHHRRYVTEKVPPEMHVAEAIQVLTKEGYNCKDRGDLAECARHEDGLLKFCRYSVLMHVNMKRRLVTKSLPDILCAKKYP